MARQTSSKPRTCADIALLCLEGAVTFYTLLRMLESVLRELGFEPLTTEGLAVVLYLTLSTQLCLLLSWPRNARAPAGSWEAAGRQGALLPSIYAAGLLGLLLLAEAGLALYSIAHAWTGLLWDLTLLATVQAFVCAGVFVAMDGSFRKTDRLQREEENVQADLTLTHRRRRPGG
ncbi:hypothetical protein EGW08_000900 [Elysia chlorotica]|uniref:Uncharacterized protein n=1 Tax=Elysia chlorotica TaxID=188477 RepID=A0A3S1BTK6_ELYCH|nr:hypothetical protein EGW08_000900 [Elysia chlorotica]